MESVTEIPLAAAPNASKPVDANVETRAADDAQSVVFEELPAPLDDAWFKLCTRLRALASSGCRGGRGRLLCGLMQRSLVLSLASAYLAYLAYCTYLLATRFRGAPEAEQSVRLPWVSGTAAALISIRRCSRCELWASTAERLETAIWRPLSKRLVRPAAAYWWVAEAAIIAGFLVWMAAERPRNLVSAAGAVLILASGLAISAHPDRVNWKPVLGGIVIQLIFAALILRTVWGFEFFNFLGDRTAEFVHHSTQGSQFLFGSDYSEHYFAFGAVICRVGACMEFVMGTTAAESLVAAANILVGQTEAPLMVRPFLKYMTSSEIHSVMTSGFATMSGSIMAAYIALGVPARHLLSASVMSAPAALALSKLVYPETHRSLTRVADLRRLRLTRYGNVIEAAGMGAAAALAVVGAIAANLIAFISILTFVNASLTWLGHRAGLRFPLTFEYILSFLFWPLALAMGVSPRDCRQVAELIGIKTFLNEFIAYQRFSAIKQNYRIYMTALGNHSQLEYQWVGTDVLVPSLNVTLLGGILFEDRSLVIATYSLCGFSNLGSIGILIGALSAMAPARASDIAGCALRAMTAGSLACFLTACIAGLFFTDSDQVLF